MISRRINVMKKLSIIVVGFALLLPGCKRATDVLATYTGGRVTRGEFNDWMEFRNMPKEAILKNKSQQKNQIEQLAAEKLTIQEAKKSGFDKSENFSYLNYFLTQNFYAQYLTKAISNKGEFKERAAKVRIIKLMVRNYKIVNNRRVNYTGEELESRFRKKIDNAKSVLSELRKGISFEELAKKYSEDFSKRKGGDIGYIIDGMRSKTFTDAVFALKKGEVTKEPVRDGNAVYIIKVDDLVTLTPDTIDDVVEDKAQRMSLKRRLMYNSAAKLQENLLNAKNVENNADKVDLRNPPAVVYKIGDKEFRVSDLNRLVDFIVTRKRRMGFHDAGLSDAEKRRTARNILQQEVLMREAKKRGYDKDEKFKKELNFTMGYYLASTYQTEVILNDVRITPREVREYYNKNLERMFTRNIKEGSRTLKKPVPFGTIRNSIEYRLLNIKRSEKIKGWTEELLKKNDFKINLSELTGK
jgi:peptidyl-prolyl cis-trans isomerase C